MNGRPGAEIRRRFFNGYGVIYFVEILSLLAAVVVIGPLADELHRPRSESSSKLGLAEFPG